MTLTELIADVRSYVKRPTTVSDAKITSWINWAQRYVARLHTFQEMHDTALVHTVDGTINYSYPTDTKEVYDIVVENASQSQKLDFVHYTDFHLANPLPTLTTEAMPTQYSDVGNQFYVFPIPDKVYHLNLTIAKFPVRFLLATQESELVDKDDLIVLAATMFGLILLREDATVIKGYGELFGTLLASAIGAEPQKPDWRPTVSKSTYPTGLSQYWLDPHVKHA